MTDGRGAGAEVWLPSGAPDELVDFVDGRTQSVEIDVADLGWLPLPADVPAFAEPSVVIDHGWSPTAVSFEIGWGQFGANPAVRVVIVDGALSVATSGLSDGTARALSEWGATFNRALSANHRQLDSLRVNGSLLRITTRSPLAMARADAAVALPVALAALWALRRPTPAELPPWRQRSRPAKTLLAIAIVLLSGGGVVIVATALRDAGDSDAGPPSTPPRSASTTIGVPPTPGTTDVPTDVTTPEATVSVLPPEPPPTTAPIDTTSTTEVTSSSDVTTTSENRIAFGPDPRIPPTPPPTTSTTTPPPPVDTTKNTLPTELLDTCGESTVRVDINGNGVADECEALTYYLTEVALPPLPGPPGTFPPAPAAPSLAATGSDSNVPLQLGILLILAGLTAMVAAHRRSSDDRTEQRSG